MPNLSKILQMLFQAFFWNGGMWIGAVAGWGLALLFFPEPKRPPSSSFIYEPPHNAWYEITHLPPGIWCILIGAAIGASLWEVTRSWRVR